jgi:hypothetical protein
VILVCPAMVSSPEAANRAATPMVPATRAFADCWNCWPSKPAQRGPDPDRDGTAKGLLPAALQAAGYQLFPINPLAVSRYRDRYLVSRDLGVPLVGTAAGTRPPWVIFR